MQAEQTTDTLKFLQHTLPTPIITPTDRIMKATKHLKQAIEIHTTPGPDELEAIAALKALINGTTPDPPLPELAPELQPNAIVETVEPMTHDSTSHHSQTDEMPTPLPYRHHPTAIPFEDDELDNASVIGVNDIPPP